MGAVKRLSRWGVRTPRKWAQDGVERLVRPHGEVEMEKGLENSRILPGRRNIRGQGQAQKSASASPASHLEACQ